jgi:D-amino-acid dehydrogenase
VQPSKVIVIGAGIVGTCCALWLQKRGYQVFLIDRDDPGSGTSSGNACTLADYACVPVNNPGLFKKIPYLLFSKDSPFSIDPLYALSHPSWLLKFLNHCRAHKVDGIIQSLGALLKHTAAGFDPLIEQTKASHLFKQDGCLYVYRTKQAHESAYPYNLARRENGVQFDWLDANEIKALEPSLVAEFYSGLYYHQARHTVNPKQLVSHFFEHFLAAGGEFKRVEVHEVSQSGPSIILEGGDNVIADKVVIAAGAFTKQIKETGTASLPLDTERGYHVQYNGKQTLLQRPVGWAEAGLYATPTNEGLRFAGTVEIAGLNKPAGKRNIQYLSNRAKEMFALEETPDQTWLGFRPTLPDALPVIGCSPQSPHIVYAFGHQHIGLTLAGITGKLVAEVVAEVETSVDISAFSPTRFNG